MVKKSTFSKGFTLIEIAIVLVIIGLIAGSITIGQDMLQKAKGKGILAELNDYLQAIETFEEMYEYLPGDMPLAEMNRTFDGDANDGTGGDGNGNIDTVGEREIMWPQLAQADMISQDISPVSTLATSTRIVGENRPKSVIDNGAWTWVTSFTVNDGTSDHTMSEALRFGGTNSATANGGEYFERPIVTLDNHRYVDSKIDAENTPVTGKITVGEASCIRDDAGVIKYVIATSDDDVKCTLNYVESIVVTP